MFKNKLFIKGERHIFAISFLVAIAIYSASGFFIRFNVTLNDFWGVLYYAKHLTISEPASWYNGFFPVGYPFILSLIPYGYVIYFAFMLNILFAGLFAGSLSTFFYTMRKSGWGVIPVFIVAVFYPLIFRYANTISPDMGTAAFSLAGIYLLWKSEFQDTPNSHQTRDDFLAGLLFGLAALFRGHGIISSVAILFAYSVMIGVDKLWARKIIPITLVLIFLIQVGINLASGHGPLETAQNFTAYITFYGIDWWHIPPEAQNFSIVNQFFKDPAGFVLLLIPLFLKLVVYGIPALLCIFILPNQVERKYAWFVLITTLIYSLTVAIGTSATDRGPFPILGMSISCIGLLGMDLWSRGRKLLETSKPLRALALVALAAASLWLGSSWFATNWDFLSLFREQSSQFRQVEDKLVALGMKSPTEAFTNKFVMYFPNMPPFRPYSNGGWESVSLWGYRDEFPEIPTDTWENFIAACSVQHIKFLVLSPGAWTSGDFLGTLYNNEFHPSEVEFVGKIHYTRIYKIIK